MANVAHGVGFGVHRDHAGLTHNNTLALHVDERICRTEVNPDIFVKHVTDPILNLSISM
ncbi:hypothetical protein SDC9_136597 [bioreactor metagenome]|uniref:Uncharacterized protein n=1 Tax=bioreactor metagenome TaxID=1076179 RepID=A0A645DK95_9ZZZZ